MRDNGRRARLGARLGSLGCASGGNARRPHPARLGGRRWSARSVRGRSEARHAPQARRRRPGHRVLGNQRLSVYALASLAAPADLHSIGVNGRAPRSLTSVNAGTCSAQRSMSEFEQFSFKGWNDETVYGYVMKPFGFKEGERFPVAFIIHGGPQVALRQCVELPLESADLRRPWIRRRVHRFPRLARLRPGVHRFDQPGTGAASRSVDLQKGPRCRARKVSMARRRARLRARRLVRRLHGQLDRGPVAGPLQVPRQSRRHLRPAHDVLLDRRAVVPGMGERRARTTQPRRRTSNSIP